MVWMILGTLATAISSLLVYLYFFQKGQFEKMEDVKYQLFFEDEE